MRPRRTVILPPPARLAALVGLVLLAAATAGALPTDAIVARVNGTPILLSELKEAALNQDIPIDALTLDGLRGEKYRLVLTQLVDEELLVQEARQSEIRVDDVEIARLVDAMINQLRVELGGMEALEAFLRKHSLTLDSLRRMLTRRERRGALAARVVARRVNLDAEALADFARRRREAGLPLEEVNLAQILLVCPPALRGTREGEEVHTRALRLAREIGGDTSRFTELAMQHTEDPAGRSRGGYIGWMDPQGLLGPLRDAVAAMDPGEVSAPVATDEGYHVLLLLGRRSTRDLMFAEQFEKQRAELLTQLRQNASIQLFDLDGNPIETIQ